MSSHLTAPDVVLGTWSVLICDSPADPLAYLHGEGWGGGHWGARWEIPWPPVALRSGLPENASLLPTGGAWIQPSEPSAYTE